MSKKLVNYTVLVRDDNIQIEDDVKMLAAKGWELQGGVSISAGDYAVTFAQAMVLYEKDS